MTYPVPPDDRGTTRVRPDAGPFWAGAVATAIVAALIALVGILICRWTLGIPILAPAGDGAWGNAHTGEYVAGAACVALLAAALLYLLMFGTPQPGLFFRWIMALATLVAIVYPFSTGAPPDQKGATAVVDLVLGIAITSLLTGVAARAVRVRRPAGPAPGRDDGYPAQRDYPAQREYPGQGGYPRQREYGPGEYRDREYGDSDPTRPSYVPPGREPRRWE